MRGQVTSVRSGGPPKWGVLRGANQKPPLRQYGKLGIGARIPPGGKPKTH